MVRLLLLLTVLILNSAVISAQTDSVLYLTGRVVMENEAPIPKDFYVQLLCSNRVIKQVNPSASGTFAFDLGSAKPTPGQVDASGTETQGGLKGGFARDAWDERGFLVIGDRVYLDVCLIRATPIPGLSSSTIELGVRDLQDTPDVGILEVKPISETPRIPPTISVTSAAAPREATKALEKAQKELRKRKINYSRVEGHLERAVEVYSQFAEAWCLLGEARLALGDHERARDAFQMSIASDESFIHPYAGLAQINVEEQNWRRAADRARQIRELDPTYPRGLLFEGIANYYLQKFSDAEQSLEELKKRGYGPTFPVAYLYLGLVYAKNGRVIAAAEALRSYLSSSSDGQIPIDRRNQIEEQLKLWEEQGLIRPVAQVSDS